MAPGARDAHFDKKQKKQKIHSRVPTQGYN